MYSSIARAGLVALVFALLIVSLVSAAPIPTHTPHPVRDLNQRDTGVLSQLPTNGRRISTPPSTTVVLPDDDADADSQQLVRRNARLNAKIKAGFKKLGSEIKHVAQKIGNGIKTAAKKVGKWMKNTGATIVKVGLKVGATIEKGLAKVAGFIPGIGKPLSKAIGVAASLTNAASDAIKAHVGKKLQNSLDKMNKAQKVMGYIPL